VGLASSEDVTDFISPTYPARGTQGTHAPPYTHTRVGSTLTVGVLATAPAVKFSLAFMLLRQSMDPEHCMKKGQFSFCHCGTAPVLWVHTGPSCEVAAEDNDSSTHHSRQEAQGGVRTESNGYRLEGGRAAWPCGAV
jgi:hypothetical protein